METAGNFITTMQYGKFKSYYVVWKHTPRQYPCELFTGLNRTMQYGNQFLHDIKAHYSIRLNRTMQYGNKTEEAEELCSIPV